jgi:hypothetical protein
MTAPTLSPSELARELDDWADNFDDAELVTLLRAAALALREREAECERLRGERTIMPAGWRLVPVEPTEEMERAGAAEVDRTNPYSDDVANNIWTVMLRAAPPAPASEGE